jgi:hypothetical protein
VTSKADRAVMGSQLTEFLVERNSPPRTVARCWHHAVCRAENAGRLVAAFDVPGMEYFPPQVSIFIGLILLRLKRLF